MHISINIQQQPIIDKLLGNLANTSTNFEDAEAFLLVE